METKESKHWTLDELKNLTVIKKFGRHGHAYSVVLLEGNIVRKIYPNKGSSLRYFKKEIKMMNHLKDCKFVAKLINYDQATLTLYMTYCGKTPQKTPKNLAKIRKGALKLHKKWGVVRRENNGKIVYDIFVPNTGIINGKIYFFDLASDKWHLEKPKNKK